jgi:hypothetical protein
MYQKIIMRTVILIFLCFSFQFSNAQNYTYTQLDSLGKNVPIENEESIGKLANYFQKITNNKNYQSRLVYSWVAHHIYYDDVAYNSHVFSDPSAEAVFKSRKAVCAGYSFLFKSICDELNIPCVTIDGFAKGYGFRESMPVTGVNHAWNAVQYNDEWHLMDPTWGSGYAENVNGKAKSKSIYNVYWFDVNPKEFMFNHFPDSSKYQFLPKKVTREQFKKLMYFETSTVFRLGFNVDSILFKSKADPKFCLPEVFNLEEINFKINKAPYSKIIKAASTHYFEIEQLSNDTIVLLNNQELILFDNKSENTFSKTLDKLKHGDLHIGILRGNAVELIVTYKVI